MPAEHWFKMAAENVDADAQIDNAEFLVSQEHTDLDDLILARALLEKQADIRDKSVKSFRFQPAYSNNKARIKKPINTTRKRKNGQEIGLEYLIT